MSDKDNLGDIFNLLGGSDEEFNKRFADFAKNYKASKDSESSKNISPRVGLIEMFDSLMHKDDRKSLEREVAEKTYLIHSINAPDLFRKHAIACLYLENNDMALGSLKMITKTYASTNELIGIIHYSKQDYCSASLQLKDMKEFSRPATSLLVKSVSDWFYGSNDIYEHEYRLTSILKKSANANTFLGVLFYNRGLYEKAQDYFIQAVILSKSSESSRLNSLRTTYQEDRESAMSQFGNFLYDTKSSMTAQQLESEMKKKKIEVPHFKIAALHIVAEKML